MGTIMERVDAACRALRPVEDECYLARRVNRAIAGIFHKHNVLGFLIDETYGGLGTDVLTYARALERIGREGSGPRTFFSCHISIGASVLGTWGTPEQKATYLPRAACGDMICGFALSEPTAGSDPASLQAVFEETDRGFLINGKKKWIGNAAEGGAVVLFARERSSGLLSAFWVEAKTPGYEARLLEHKMGLPTTGTCEITLSNCEVPRENLIGTRGKGLHVAFGALMSGRLSVAAGSVGILEDCLAEAVAYAQARVQHGKPIAAHQLVQRHIARIATNLEASRALVRTAAESKAEYDQDRANTQLRKEVDTLIAQAKLFATNAAQDAANRAVQVFGGNGFLLTNRPARHYCDVRATTIYEGTNEILLQKIAQHHLGPEFSAYR